MLLLKKIFMKQIQIFSEDNSPKVVFDIKRQSYYKLKTNKGLVLVVKSIEISVDLGEIKEVYAVMGLLSGLFTILAGLTASLSD